MSDVDYTSICWYSQPSSTSGYTSQNCWERDASKGADSDNGKIGYMLSGGLNETAKNRHVFPISYKDVNLSGQNGYGNSYGW